MGSVSNYLAKLAENRGVELKTDCEVEELLTDGSRVSGVKLSNG